MLGIWNGGEWLKRELAIQEDVVSLVYPESSGRLQLH